MAGGRTFFVDPINGNDSNSGLSATSAWQSVSKVNSQTYLAGDSVLFKAGETYKTPLHITATGTESAPVKFGSYGTGHNPVFDGSVELRGANWVETSPGSHVWTTPVAARGGEDPGRLFLNGHSANLEAATIGDVAKPGDWNYTSGTVAVFSTTSPSKAFDSVDLQVQNRMIDAHNSSHVVIDGLDVTKAHTGILLVDTDHSQVLDSTSSHNSLHGMTIVRGSDNLLQGGESFDNGIPNPDATVRAGHGVLLDATSNNVVEAMRLHDNAEDGVQFGPDGGSGGNIIRNDEIFHNGEDGIDIKSGDQTFAGNSIHDNKEVGLNLNSSGTITAIRNHIEDNRNAIDSGQTGAFISSGNVYIGGTSATAATTAVLTSSRPSSFTGDTFVDGGVTSKVNVNLANSTGSSFVNDTFVMTNPGVALRLAGKANDVTLDSNKFYTNGANLLHFQAGQTIHSDNNFFHREDSTSGWMRVNNSFVALSALLDGSFSKTYGIDEHSTFSTTHTDVVGMAQSLRDAEPTLIGPSAHDPIVGTAGNDALQGTNSSDEISGLTGNDTITGNAGNDLPRGESGNDVINGSAGADSIDAGPGRDTLQGLTGSDFIFGGADDDSGFGGDHNDSLFGDAGNNSLSGGSGNDVLMGGAGTDTLQGDTGSDTLRGAVGDDHLFGGDHNDSLFGDAGNDSLSGGDGNDVLFGGDGNDGLQGDTGRDTLDGGSGNDRLAGNGGDDTLRGAAGTDTLNGGTENDSLNGGPGADQLTGGTGNDFFVFDQRPDAPDTISDFQPGADKFELAKSAFTGLSDFASHGEFVSASGNPAPVNNEPTLLYNTQSGALSFDSDGRGPTSAFQVATLSNHAALTEHDFLLK